MKKLQSIFILTTAFSCASAVNINPGGYGEAVILPYYTVNNNLNTIMTINNSTEMTKAIKVHFREGKAGKAVLSFNLYLAPNDMWAAGLVPALSSIPGHVGEASVKLLTVDQSCAPFLIQSQEFLPYEVEAESDDTDLARSREGFIEVIEMGELDPTVGLGLAATFNSDGSNGCAAIQAALAGGIWDESNGGDLTQQLMPTDGGISANVGLIDVAEGLMYSLDGVAFENFYPNDSVFHTDTGETRIPSLEHADTTSVVINDGEPVSTVWEHGYQAISAVLMKHQLESFYDISPHTDSKTEVVLSMPTKRFYEGADDVIELPFERVADSGQYDVCAKYDVGVFDRETDSNICTNDPWGVGCLNKNNEDQNPNLTPIPPGSDNDRLLCHAVGVVQLSRDNEAFSGEPTKILGSQAFEHRDVVGFDSGKMLMAFDQLTASTSGDEYHGLPVLVYSLVKYTNANAAPGMLAQYGGTYQVNYKTDIDQP